MRLVIQKICSALILIGFGLVFDCSAYGVTLTGDLRFERLTSVNGLNVPFSTVISQDQQGYMWFGTQSNLYRYDGYRSKPYGSCAPNSNIVDGGYVYSMYNDSHGRFWIGTGAGLCLYDPEHDRLILQQNINSAIGASAEVPVLEIVGDDIGNLWLLSSKGMLHFFPDSGQAEFVPFPDNVVQALKKHTITALRRDQSGTIWVGCAIGLFRLSPGAKDFQPIKIYSNSDVNAKQPEITALWIDSDRNLWIGTSTGIVLGHLDDSGNLNTKFSSIESDRHRRVTDILQDSLGDIWIATQSEGLLRLDHLSGHTREYRHSHHDARSIVTNEISNLFQDRAGSVWIGTPIDGISKVELDSGDFNRISNDTRSSKGLAENKVSAIFDGPNGSLWLGSFSGSVSAYDPKAGVGRILPGQVDTTDDAGRYNTTVFKAFAFERPNAIWMLNDSGLKRYDLKKEKYDPDLKATNAPDYASLVSVDMGHDGTIWTLSAQTLYGLTRDRSTWLKYEMDVGLVGDKNPDSFKTVHIDSAGEIWVLTTKRILSFDKKSGKFSVICDRPRGIGTGNGAFLEIFFKDSKGNFWVDNESGFSRIEMRNGMVRSIRNVQTSAMVDAFVEDKNGTIWVVTDDGVVRVDPSSMQSRHFNSLDDESLTGYFFYASYLAADGTIYLGGPHGLTSFDPKSVGTTVRPKPPVLITDLQVFNQSINKLTDVSQTILKTTVQTSRSVTLPYSATVFSLEFAALDYGNSNANRYAFQLEGFDQGWRFSDARNRLVTYTNLNPGHYVFRVKASNNQGLWNDEGATLDVIIEPPFWRTWWFRTAVAMILVGGVFTLYRLRVSSLLRQRTALESIVGQRTQEVVNQKNLIEQKNKQLEAINQQQEEHQSELTHFLAVASHDLRQPIHALNIYLGALIQTNIGQSSRAIFEKMTKCVQIMDEMFLSLLDLSLLDAHAVKPRIERFSIATVLSLIEVEFYPQAHAAGLTLNIEHCNDWVESDANLIKQILANLVANAIRYTKTGSITVRCVKQSRVLRVSVIDTGIGISTSQQSIVFKKFHQLGNTDREKSKGIGLGLAIVKRLCELLQLTLTLQSEPGRGSTFTVDLPLSEELSEPTRTSSVHHIVSDISLANLLVVVIDDDQTILDAMRMLLERWGCEVTTATTGGEAIDLLGSTPRVPDLLICDYRLHVNEDGIETINRLRNEFNSEIPALLITGDTSSDPISDLQSPRISVLHKPLRAEPLRDTIVRVMFPDAFQKQTELDHSTSSSDTKV